MDDYELRLPDPDTLLQRTLARNMSLRLPGMKKKPAHPPLPPDEEKSLLNDVLGTGIGGLQYLGETLDKPGRAVRGALSGLGSGDFGKVGSSLLNLIPFSDTMGLTDPAKSTSGRDLLEQAGLLDKNEEGIDWGDVAGFGAEVLTDPTSFLMSGAKAIGAGGKLLQGLEGGSKLLKGSQRLKTLGTHLAENPHLVDAATEAFTKGGGKLENVVTKAAQAGKRFEDMGADEMVAALAKSGHSYDDIAKMTPQQARSVFEGLGKTPVAAEVSQQIPKSLMDQQVGGLFGLTSGPFGLLGMHADSIPKMAQGPTAQKILGGLDAASGWIGGTAPARAAKSLFQHQYKGMYDPADQALAVARTTAEESMRPKQLEPWLNLRTQLSDINKNYVESLGGQNPIPADIADRFERLAGLVADKAHPRESFERLGLPFHQQTSDALVNAIHDIGAAKDDLWNRALDLGVDSKSMPENEAFAHSARYLQGKGDAAVAGTTYKGSPDSAHGRVEATKFLPREIVNDIYKDPEVADWTKALSAKTGESFQLGSGIKAKDIEPLTGGWSGLGTQKPVVTGDLADVLTKKYGKFLNDAAVAEGIGPDEVAKNLAEHLTSRNAMVQKLAKSKQDLYGKFIPDSYKYFDEVGRTVANRSAMQSTMAKSLVPGGVPVEKVFKDAGFNVDAAMNSFTRDFGQIPAGHGVSPEVANAVLNVSRKTESPKWLKFLGELFDTATKPFKSNVTLPWPSFLTRNLGSGQVMWAMSNEIPDIQHGYKYLGRVDESRKLLKDFQSGKGDKALINEMTAHKVYDAHNLHSLGEEIGSHNMGFGFSEVPNPITMGGMKQNLKDAVQGAHDVAYGTAKEPLGPIGNALPGPMKTLRKGAAVPAQVGAQLNAQVEWVNRVGGYLYLRKDLGWSAEAAAAKVRQLQVDYSQLAPFEKDVMKRLVPFYTYIRKTVPAMVEQMAQRPGGVTAQVVRASNTGRSEGEFVPPYVGEGMSVKLGDNTYLSGLGLPTDQFSDLYAQGPTAASTVARTGQKLLSMGNPYLKGPLEAATGQNFFTGRPMAESFQYPTGNPLVNQVLHNSPVARVITTSRKLIDPDKSLGSKAWNTLTGVQIHDEHGGLDKQRSFAEQKILKEILSQSPGIGVSTDVYQKKDKQGKPMEIDATTEKYLQALGAIKKRQAAEAKKKKKQLQP